MRKNFYSAKTFSMEKKEMNTRYWFFICAFLALLCLAGVGCQTPARNFETAAGIPTEPDGVGGGTGWIAFTATRDGNIDLYMIKLDGSEEIRLTDDPSEDAGLLFSPDGKQIAFYSDRDGNREVYLMNADGSGLKRLTNNPADDYPCYWSADGSKIAIYSSTDARSLVYLLPLDGSDPIPLATSFCPAWSPDGRQMVWADDGIFLSNADGSEARQLTDGLRPDFMPVWSPDGEKIAFHSTRDGTFEIYMMNPDGSDQVRLTQSESSSKCPAWSPDGKWIAFHHMMGEGNTDLFVLRIENRTLFRLTEADGAEVCPHWQPGVP